MNDKLEQQLIKIDQTFFECYRGDVMTTCMHWGCECGDGWFEPLKQLVEKVAGLNKLIKSENAKIVADQIKEKFGELRCYTSIKSIDDSKPITNTNLVNTVGKLLDDAIKTAENQCWDICESCGCKNSTENPLITTSGWVNRICTDCSIGYYFNCDNFARENIITNFNNEFMFLNPAYETSFKYMKQYYNSYIQCYLSNILPTIYKEPLRSMKNSTEIFILGNMIKKDKGISDDFRLAKDILHTIFNKDNLYGPINLLLKTKKYPIQYLNRSCDNVWGQCVCEQCKKQNIVGQNMWGKLLMEVRNNEI